MDHPAQVAFQSEAPAAERHDAQIDLIKSHGLRDLLPPAELQPVIDWINDDLAKSARVIPFPNEAGSRQGGRGSKSVILDRFQAVIHGDGQFDRPGLNMDALRAMVEQTPVLSAVVLTRSRQLVRFCGLSEDGGLGFEIRHIDRKHKITLEEERSLALLGRFISNCGWEFQPRARRLLGRDSFPQLMVKLVRDSLTLDAAAIETEWKKNRTHGIDGLYAVDGGSIRLCTEEGYLGDDNIFAVQIVQGQVRTAYTRDDLIYEPRNPRTDLRLAGYGMSEVELLVRCVTGFLNAMTVNLKGFSENAIPKGILHLVGEYSPEDLIAFKRYWNQTVKGVNNAWALPVMVSKESGEVNFEKIDSGFTDVYFSKWMTFLTAMICAVFGMSPDEINFESFTAQKSSLSGSDTAEKLAESKDKGQRPLMSYFENLLTDFVIREFSEKYVFRWVGLDEEDQQQAWEAKKLALTLNELRAEQGYEPVKGPLGEAPLNPSLIGPWMQLQGGGGQPQGQGGPPGQPGEEGKPGQPGGAKGPPQGDENNPPDHWVGGGQGEEEPAQKALAVGFPVVYTL